jgi:hypothetical protein
MSRYACCLITSPAPGRASASGPVKEVTPPSFGPCSASSTFEQNEQRLAIIDN